MAKIRAINTAPTVVQCQEEMVEAVKGLQQDLEKSEVACLALLWINKDGSSTTHIIPGPRFTTMVGLLQTATFNLCHGA